jgi:hypothetical protein
LLSKAIKVQTNMGMTLEIIRSCGLKLNSNY